MNISTLNFIHEILIEKEKATRAAKKMANDAWRKAEQEGAENADDLRNIVSKTRESWCKAREALNDFEEKRW